MAGIKSRDHRDRLSTFVACHQHWIDGGPLTVHGEAKRREEKGLIKVRALLRYLLKLGQEPINKGLLWVEKQFQEMRLSLNGGVLKSGRFIGHNYSSGEAMRLRSDAIG